MNKVVCDICGTSYPDTATCCPICGFARDGKLSLQDEDVVMEEETAEETYTAVKGGRFSRANVRKRNNGVAPAPMPSREEEPEESFDEEEEPDKKPKKESNTGLIVVLVLLLLAIVAVIVYIYMSFFAPQGTDQNPFGSTTEPSSSSSEQTASGPVEIPCTDLSVSETVITLDAVGNAWLLNVVAAPADTTDVITYTSDNEAVATVNESGRITAVGPGTATVTVTCGSMSIQCSVTCTIGTEPSTEPTTEPTTAPTTEPTTAPTTAPTEPQRAWKLNRTEITFSDKYPTPWTLYEGSISKNSITFASDDESVATFVNGVVTPVGNGTTVVRATYNGETLTCTVYVKFSTQTTEPTTAPTTEPTTTPTTEPTTEATGDSVG